MYVWLTDDVALFPLTCINYLYTSNSMKVMRAFSAIIGKEGYVRYQVLRFRCYRACKLFNIRLYATLCFNYFR